LTIWACAERQPSLPLKDFGFIAGIEDRSRLEYGYLQVPENHDEPEGRQIEIAWAIIKAKAPQTGKPPIIFLTGGPGGETLPMIPFMLDFPLTEDRDLILFDQRGIGYSSPLPDFAEGLVGLLAADLSSEAEERHVRALLEEYREKAARQGIQLQQYNTFQNARDIGQLMEVLPYEQYCLLGVSYGTRLARLVMDYSPGQIAGAVLDSPSPFEDNFIVPRLESFAGALRLVFEHCESEPGCRTAYPHLRQQYLEGVARLNQNPVKVALDSLDFYVNAQDAIYLLRYQLYRGDALEGVPQFIQAIHERDEALLKQGIVAVMPIIADGNYSMFLSTERYEHYNPHIGRAELQSRSDRLGFFPAPLAFFTSLYLAAGDWHGGQAAPAQKSFQASAIPTMIFVNQFDPVTPPENGRLMLEKLPQGRLFILDEGGHGEGNFECKLSVIRAFFDAPLDEPDTACLRAVEMRQGE
jgi:pimeloyl-ACP methyl ester carboxylesterase